MIRIYLIFLLIVTFSSLAAQERSSRPDSIVIDTHSLSDSLSPESLKGLDAPKFIAKTIEGLEIDLNNSQGKTITVLNFWFIGCGPCRKEIPFLSELVEQNVMRSDIRFIAISNIDSERALVYVQQKLGIKYELIAKAQHIADAYHVKLYPTNVVVDKSGKVVYAETGYQHDVKDKLQHVINTIK